MIIVAGTIRIPPEKLNDWRPHARAVIEATRSEGGCRLLQTFEAGEGQPL